MQDSDDGEDEDGAREKMENDMMVGGRAGERMVRLRQTVARIYSDVYGAGGCSRAGLGTLEPSGRCEAPVGKESVMGIESGGVKGEVGLSFRKRTLSRVILKLQKFGPAGLDTKSV